MGLKTKTKGGSNYLELKRTHSTIYSTDPNTLNHKQYICVYIYACSIFIYLSIFLFYPFLIYFCKYVILFTAVFFSICLN
uniref:Uncharacterized protein n=1 Tax=Cynoglossus semilaevis TaxID=244447 RepID=A0A3P8VBA0_CYNSE